MAFCTRGDRSGSTLTTRTSAREEGGGQWMENDKRRHQGCGMFARPTH